MKFKTYFLIATILLCMTAQSQAGLRSKRIGFAAGLMQRMEATVTASPTSSVSTTFDGAGAVASLSFGSRIAGGTWGTFYLGANALEAKTEVNWYGQSVHSLVLMPIMAGLRHYPFHNLETGFQPYFYIGGGPIVGIESRTRSGLVTSTSTESQTTLGGQAGAGVDFMIASWLAFELDGGYTVMQDFSQPFGSRDNFNGWAASFGVSFFWGR